MQHGPDDNPSDVAVKYVHGWKMLRQYLCRKLGRKGLTFLAIFEKHPTSGFPHLHILLREKYISRTLIKEWWEKEGYGYIVDIRKCHNPRQAAGYVTKYIAKDPGAFEHCKRYWGSHDWDPPKEEPRSKGDGHEWWEVSHIHPNDLAGIAYRDGARIEYRGQLLIIEQWSFKDRALWGLG